MDNNQRGLVELLSATISGRKVDYNQTKNLDWETVFENAISQDIVSTVYPVIKNLDEAYRPKDDIINKWKNISVRIGLTQKINNSRFITIIKRFNEANIPVMGLKGVILRELYPQKDLRNMSDIDLLVHQEDLEAGEKLLLDMGYVEVDRDSKHIQFAHEKYIPIELHCLLIDVRFFKNADLFEEDVWKNVKQINVGNAVVLAPSDENQLIYAFIHIGVHFAYSGFGLRQLADLVVLINKKTGEIDWINFEEKIEEYKIKEFVVAILHVCDKLFKTGVPKNLYDKKIEDSSYLEMIIKDVLFGGIFEGQYGKLNICPVDDHSIDYFEKHSKSNGILNKIGYSINFLFPMPSKLNKRYDYARKLPVLLPIAWIHRLGYSIIRKDISKKDKGEVLFLNSDVLKKRAELFKWLDL